MPISPVNWLTDEAYLAAPLGERTLAWADYFATLKVREIGVNRGYWVERFLKAVGLGPGYAWCAAFLSFCLLKAGRPDFGPKKGRAAVRNWKRWAAQNNLLIGKDKVARGDIGGWLNSNQTGHIFLIRSVERGDHLTRVGTLEGNTNDAGSREGDGVYKRERLVRDDFFFIRVGEG